MSNKVQSNCNGFSEFSVHTNYCCLEHQLLPVAQSCWLVEPAPMYWSSAWQSVLVHLCCWHTPPGSDRVARSYGVSCRRVPAQRRLLQNFSAFCSISAAPGEKVDIHVPSSLTPLTKLPPLSERISSGRPLLATNLRNALINDSVSSELTTSMWTVRRAKHVKMIPYLLTLDRPRRTSKGPKQSTPVNVKGGLEGVTRSTGRLAVFCWPVGDWCFLQVRHFSSILRTADLAFMIQYLWRMRDRVYSSYAWVPRNVVIIENDQLSHVMILW